jgi:hypothetical protein
VCPGIVEGYPRGGVISKPIRYCLPLWLALSAAAAAPFAPPRPAVVELFTSEGCSSCPPAEAVIGDLTQRADVLALSFHVSYWDSLGWRDPFALPDAVLRQQQYAKSLGHASVYTPQVILDGHADYLGSDRGAIEAAVRGVRTGVGVDMTVRGGDLVVDLGGGQCLAPSDVLLIAYLRKAVSKIGRGENAGRTLQEFNIVRSVHKVGQWNGSPQRLQVSMSSLPADATDAAVVVQSSGPGQIVGAASHSLH